VTAQRKERDMSGSPIDYDVVRRVLGDDMNERYGETVEYMSDGYNGPALLCMAFERFQADPSRSIDQHMGDLLDAWDVYNAS
jgi:hypothetical protein